MHQQFPYVCSTCETTFSQKQGVLYVQNNRYLLEPFIKIFVERELRKTVGEVTLQKYIKTHDNELQGQEEAAIIHETKITRPLSELFTRKTLRKSLTL